jgi:hypothetical protein
MIQTSNNFKNVTNCGEMTKKVRNNQTDCSEESRTEHEQRNCKTYFEESLYQNGTERICAPPPQGKKKKERKRKKRSAETIHWENSG